MIKAVNIKSKDGWGTPSAPVWTHIESIPRIESHELWTQTERKIFWWGGAGEESVECTELRSPTNIDALYDTYPRIFKEKYKYLKETSVMSVMFMKMQLAWTKRSWETLPVTPKRSTEGPDEKL